MIPSQIRGLILAGNRREYCHYLFRHHLKERQYPQLTHYNQLSGYHALPPVLCTGSYQKNDKFVECRRRAVLMGAEVVDDKL